MKFKNFPIYRIEWVTSIFLIGTALLSLTVVPWFLWTQYHLPADAANKVQGWGFIWALFVFYYYATGFGITSGISPLVFTHFFQSQVAGEVVRASFWCSVIRKLCPRLEC
jgi:hypothetical protein